ncbi:selenocysteine-specific translation elongation factor [Ramlibacter sp.]|uniref:selenocysteine-specific translation elongation factor n=1 Tax=Ramlibacter sp. TaxID=1917967 RepID=UPI003D12062B
MIVATAGHIDHGKTALVRALTGVDTDRLPEEKARGISIEIGFAHCTVGDTTLGFVDVPGHERFVRNMLSGVYAIGHVLLVVAADDGVMPQTREHLHIVDLLGVAEGTIVITKADRVDADRLLQVGREVRDLVGATRLHDAPVLAVSSLSGEGIPALRQRLLDTAANRQAKHAANDEHARYVVDRAFTVAGSGTVVTGTVISGSIAEGDLLTISPRGVEARVRKLQRHGRAAASAAAGERCALNLAGVELADVTRGDWVVAASAHAPTDRIDVQVKVLAGETQPLKHWTPVHVHIGAADVPARLALRRGAAVAPGDESIAQLRLDRAIHAVHGDRLIVRDQSATRTVGGGIVLNPFPAQLARTERDASLAALADGDLTQAAAELVKGGKDGVPLEWLARVFNVPLATAEARLPPYAIVVRADGHSPRAFSDRRVAQLQQGIVERIGRFHAKYRELGGIELSQLHADLARAIPFDHFAALVKSIAPAAGLLLRGSRVANAGHDATDNPRDLLLWQRAKPVLMQAAAMIPSVRELAATLNAPLQTLRDLMHAKSALGELVKLTPERFALPQTMDMLAVKADETSKRHGGPFSAAHYRDVIGTGRGLAIEILECFDRLGVTQRKGDLRTLRAPRPGDAVVDVNIAVEAVEAVAAVAAVARPPGRN